MKKSELRKLIKEEIKTIMEYESFKYERFDGNIHYKYLDQLGVSKEDQKAITNIYNKIAKKRGDVGSCVLGNGIIINGKLAVSSYAQGSLGLEEIQKHIIPYLQKRYPKLKIKYAWGNMD